MDPICPKCKIPMVERTGKFGKYMACPKYPNACDITGITSEWDGVFRTSDLWTRRARGKAHAVFDRIWKGGKMRRQEAYSWLQAQMRLPPYECHIQHFDLMDCKRVIALSEAKVAELYPPNTGIQLNLFENKTSN